MRDIPSDFSRVQAQRFLCYFSLQGIVWDRRKIYFQRSWLHRRSRDKRLEDTFAHVVGERQFSKFGTVPLTKQFTEDRSFLQIL